MGKGKKGGLRKRRRGQRGTGAPVILIVCEGQQTEPDYFGHYNRLIKSLSIKTIVPALTPILPPTTNPAPPSTN